MLTNLRQTPSISYHDPIGFGESLSARLALRVFEKSKAFIEISESWPSENKNVRLVILDRSYDLFTPFIHSLCYHAAIQDLLIVKDNNKITFTDNPDEKAILINHKDPFFVSLRHLFLGDAGEVIQKFIDENPAASAHYNRSNIPTTKDIHDQIYSLTDATKIIDHRVIFFALVHIFEKNHIEIIGELEQVHKWIYKQRLATHENSDGTITDESILNEIITALENEELKWS